MCGCRGPSCWAMPHCTPRPLADSLIRSGTAGTHTGAHKGYWHHRQRFNLLCHSTSHGSILFLRYFLKQTIEGAIIAIDLIFLYLWYFWGSCWIHGTDECCIDSHMMHSRKTTKKPSSTENSAMQHYHIICNKYQNKNNIRTGFGTYLSCIYKCFSRDSL